MIFETSEFSPLREQWLSLFWANSQKKGAVIIHKRFDCHWLACCVCHAWRRERITRWRQSGTSERAIDYIQFCLDQWWPLQDLSAALHNDRDVRCMDTSTGLTITELNWWMPSVISLTSSSQQQRRGSIQTLKIRDYTKIAQDGCKFVQLYKTFRFKSLFVVKWGKRKRIKNINI